MAKNDFLRKQKSQTKKEEKKKQKINHLKIYNIFNICKGHVWKAVLAFLQSDKLQLDMFACVE